MDSKIEALGYAALLLAALLACGGKTKEEGAPASTSTGAAGDSSKPPRKPDVSVTTTVLVKDYQANEVAADLRYKDKLVAVTGSGWNDPLIQP